MPVMDDESVAFATTSDDILSPLVPPLCSWLAVSGVPRCCSCGRNVRAVCVLDPSSRRHDASAQSRALSPQLRSQRLRARAETRIADHVRFARRLPIATPRGMVVSESGVLAT